jgi:hypothetical protein
MKFLGLLIACLAMLYLIYSGAAFWIFEIRHAKANRMTYYTHHRAVVTFSTVEDLR